MKSLLTPFHLLYGGITESRNWLFEQGYLKSNRIDCPVIGVGNITAGGTGKTPLVSSLLSWAVREGFRAGVVSRGYKGKYQGIEKVDPARTDAGEYYGDEPTLLAQKFLSVPVYVGAKRFEVATKMLIEQKIDFVIADDAFQHRALRRDIDIVVVDSLESRENYCMLPTGRLREPLHNIRRAHYVVLSRTNLATEDQLTWARKMLAENGIGKDRVIEATTEIKSMKPLCGPQVPPADFKFAYLFSGIGNPESFKKLMVRKYEVVGAKAFPDHHNYTRENLEEVWREARLRKADVIFATEKDAVKLRSLLTPKDDAIYSVEIESRFSNTIEILWNEITSLAR